MELNEELARLVADLPRVALAEPHRLVSAGRELRIIWPADYVTLITEHNGAAGMIGPNEVVLTPVEEIVETNAWIAPFYSDLVIIASNGGGFSIAYDRNTLDLLFFSDDGPEDSAVILGASLGEAFLHFERDDVFECPRYRPVQTPESPWPEDWRERISGILGTPRPPPP
jgi:hypothetical protein